MRLFTSEQIKQAEGDVFGRISSTRFLGLVKSYLGRVCTESESLPRPPFTEAETEEIAARVYDYVWQRSASGSVLAAYLCFRSTFPSQLCESATLSPSLASAASSVASAEHDGRPARYR